ncbi:hypothetical protein Hanom_Chr02g00160271 [Helianthus anomalus]
MYNIIIFLVFRMMMDHMDDQLELQEQVEQQQQADTLPGYPYLEFPQESEGAGRCAKLRRMHVGGHWVVCWDSLETLGGAARSRKFIPLGSRWDRLLGYRICRATERFLSRFCRRSNFILVRPTSMWTRRTPYP